MKDELIGMGYVPVKGGKRIITVIEKETSEFFAKHPVGKNSEVWS